MKSDRKKQPPWSAASGRRPFREPRIRKNGSIKWRRRDWRWTIYAAAGSISKGATASACATSCWSRRAEQTARPGCIMSSFRWAGSASKAREVRCFRRALRWLWTWAQNRRIWTSIAITTAIGTIVICAGFAGMPWFAWLEPLSVPFSMRWAAPACCFCCNMAGCFS